MKIQLVLATLAGSLNSRLSAAGTCDVVCPVKIESRSGADVHRISRLRCLLHLFTLQVPQVSNLKIGAQVRQTPLFSRDGPCDFIFCGLNVRTSQP